MTSAVRAYSTRLDAATEFEVRIIEQLCSAGCKAWPFGQGLLPEDARQFLKTMNTPVRWLPDIMAWRRDLGCIYVDAKDSDHNPRGNHAVETRSSETMMQWLAFSRCPVVYAFPCGGYCHIRVWNAVKFAGRFNGNGSGTPFMLGRHDDTCSPSVEAAIMRGNQVKP